MIISFCGQLGRETRGAKISAKQEETSDAQREVDGQRVSNIGRTRLVSQPLLLRGLLILALC